MPLQRFTLAPVTAAVFLCIATGAQAQTANDGQPAVTLGTVTVNASADASAEGLTKPYAGGQVARGGRVGILGNQDNMDTPFSVTSYTNELIQNQQARSVGDVLRNDPSVRLARGFGNFQESYFIRGFILGSDFMAYNGLYSLLPRQYISSELFERVEVLRGASAFLTGATPGSGDGIGGVINLLPKRATNEPLNQVTVGTASGGQAYVAADISRRFGPDQSTGIRVNAAHREGGTGITGERVRLDVASVGLDWRGRDLRLSADIGHQEHRLNGTRSNVTLGAVTAVPSAPSSKTNWAQPWSYSDERDTFGTVRGEYDLGTNTTAWFAAGARRGNEANSLANLSVSNSTTGAGTTYRFDNTGVEDVKTAELGLRSKLQTGSVSHALVASYSYFGSERANAYAFDFANTQSTNLYNPTPTANQPAFSAAAGYGGNLASPNVTSRKRLTSIALGDTLGFLDDSLLLTLGLRHQVIDTSGYAYGTSALTSRYDQSRTSPAAGVVYKLRKDVSLYANYIEGLSPGDSAPAVSGGVPVANSGQVFAPYVSKQKEVGVKYDGGNIGGSVALFSVERPRAFFNAATGYYGPQGKDEHKGIEFNVQGEPQRGMRVLGGLTLLEALQKSTGSSTTDGRKVIGVPNAQASLGGEWDVPSVRGLTLSARVVATGGSYTNATNTLRAPGWGVLDVGARYTTELGGRLVTFRGRIDNLADKSYWSSVGGYPGSGYLVLGAPRTFSLTATVEF